MERLMIVGHHGISFIDNTIATNKIIAQFVYSEKIKYKKMPNHVLCLLLLLFLILKIL